MQPIATTTAAAAAAGERDALLARHSRRSTRRAPHGRSRSSRDVSTGGTADDERAADGDDDEVEEEEAASMVGSDMSHVLLDSSPTYTRLICAHVMSLLPCIALLLASVMLVWHAPCHVHQAPVDRAQERRTCKRMLSDRVSLAAFALGLVCWLAAYAVRPAIWKTIALVSALARLAEYGSGKLSPGATTVIFVLVKTIVLELLRLFSVLLGNALIIAGLLRISGQDSNAPPDNDHHYRRWVLHWFDPRFTIAVWVAIGWAVTEFFVTSWQMFDRLALYEVDFDDAAPHDEEDVGQEAVAEVAPDSDADGAYPIPSALRAQYLSDSDPGADYSDSAATVRGNNAQTNGKSSAPVLTATTSASSAPGARLLDARRRVRAAAEESGISLARSDLDAIEDDKEVEELGVLREKLDVEMDGLVKARTRVELEATFGQPLTSVPIVLCTLWRVDGCLWNLGSTLLMSASVTLAQGPLVGDQAIPPLFPPMHLTMTTLLTLIGLHTAFTTMWTVALPTFGFAFVTYASMLAGVGLCVAASARWGLLV